MNRRDWLLEEMGISQWALRKPQVLKGDAQIRLSAEIALVVVCEEDWQTSRLFGDVLRALNLKPHQYQWFSLKHASRLAFSHSPYIWLIASESQAVEFAAKFAEQTLWRHSAWQDLHASAAKRQFWQQLEPCAAALSSTAGEACD